MRETSVEQIEFFFPEVARELRRLVCLLYLVIVTFFRLRGASGFFPFCFASSIA